MNAFSRKSLYAQVRDVLADEILSGSWKPSSSIPNEVDLAKTYGVSVGTLRKALSMLGEEGLVHRRQGRGTFVSDPSSSDLRDRFEHLYIDNGERAEPDVRQLGCMEHSATPEEREHLAVSQAEKVVVCRQIVRFEKKPAIYREAHFARKLLPEFNLCETWDVFVAARKYGLRLGDGVEKLSLRRPDPHVAAALGIDATVTLLVLDRIVFAFDGKPIEWLLSWSELAGMYYSIMLSSAIEQRPSKDRSGAR